MNNSFVLFSLLFFKVHSILCTLLPLSTIFIKYVLCSTIVGLAKLRKKCNLWKGERNFLNVMLILKSTCFGAIWMHGSWIISGGSLWKPLEVAKSQDFWFFENFQSVNFLEICFCFWHYLSGTFPWASKYFLVMGKHSLC